MSPRDDHRRIVAVAGDAGGAAALAPVVRSLMHDANRVSVLAYREAPRIFAEAGLSVTDIPVDADDAWLLPWIEGAALLLTATSVNGVDRERQVWALGRRQGIPSLAVLDFWSNYRQRFEDAGGRLELPDHIAVMDELALDEMTTAGFPAERLVVTGQPAFDALAERKTAFDVSRRQQIRRELGASDDDLLVLFVSQPFADLYGGRDIACATLGFEEHGVCRLCATTLEQMAAARQRRIAFAIRRHPRESGSAAPIQGNAWFRATDGNGPHRLDAVLAADLVIGMNSVLLLEAVLLGCRVLSVQPGRRTADPLPSNRDGRSLAVEDESALPGAIEQALFDTGWRPQQLLNSGCGKALNAAAAVAALAKKIISNHEHI